MPVSELINIKIDVPESVNVRYENGILEVSGPKGKIFREFKDDKVRMDIENRTISIRCDLPKRKDAALAGTWEAHVKNMIKGVTEGFTYKLKIVYAHFPMKVSVKGKEILIENFMGEKSPRKAYIKGDVKVEVKGDTVTVTGINIEDVGQTAANIERATRIKDYDPRVFQDGIYIVSKGEE